MSLKMNEILFRELEKSREFHELAERVDAKTRLYASMYVMRYDGTLIFLETLNRGASGEEIIVGNPVRFPRKPGIRYDGAAKTNRIFGCEYFNIMKILNGGKLGDSHYTQVEEIERIKAIQKGTDYEIAEFAPAVFHIGSSFKRAELIYAFPFETAFDYFYNRRPLESVRYLAGWMKEQFGVEPDSLGLTGSAAVGIMDDKEDVDLCFIAPCKKLVEIKQGIVDGVRNGKYTPVDEYGHVWPLRVMIKGYELCPFFIPRDYEFDYSSIEIGLELHDLHGTISDDTFNMMSPIHFKIFADGSREEHEVIITNGFCRGHFFKGDRIVIKNYHEGRVKTSRRELKPVVVLGWNSVRKI